MTTSPQKINVYTIEGGETHQYPHQGTADFNDQGWLWIQAGNGETIGYPPGVVLRVVIAAGS